MRPCAVLSALAVALAGLLSGCDPAPKPRATPLTHSAYVWKQGWTAEAARGLSPTAVPAAITELNILVGECGLGGGSRAVRVPWEAVKGSGRRIAVSVRIGTSRTQAGLPRETLAEGLGLVLKGLEGARQAGVSVGEVQIDYDCPTRLLGDYAGWLAEARRELPADIRLTVTTLPSWLDARGFDRLIEAADGWTLQLHGTARARADRHVPLVAADQALAWIAEAEGLGKPFRVALPTYSYLACFGADGRYLGVRAEAGERPRGTAQTRLMPADPEEILPVLRALQDARHERVTGVDWFRLPMPGDRQNWTPRGLAEVIAGRTLNAGATVALKPQGALTDIEVANDGEQPIALPDVTLEWSGAGLVGADGTVDWRVEEGDGRLTFRAREDSGFLAPGERKVVGWMRLSEARKVTVTTER